MGASALVLALAAIVPARADTLADAVALAYANNPNLRAQRAAQQAVDETYVQARSAYGPRAQITGTGTYEEVRGKFFGGQTGEVGHLANRDGSATLQVTQSIYSGGRNHAAVSAAEANILAQRATLKQTEIQVLQQVITSYVAVRRDQQTVEVYEDTVQALERQLRQVEAEFGVRQVTQTDVDEARGRVALARANAANAHSQLEISRSQYLQVVGENPGTLAPEPPLETPPDLNTAFDIAEADNPALQNALYQEQGARVRVAQARANYLPNLTAEVDLGRSPVEPYEASLGDQTTVIAAVSLNQPLYTSGLYASQVRQALAEVNQARALVEASRRTAVQSVSQAWSQLVAARIALVADQNGVTATQAAFYGVRREQPFGLRETIDVLNAEQELNNAQVRLLQDRYGEYVARASVLAAAGVLDIQMLSPQTPRIRPETSFNRIKGRGVPPWVGALQAIDSVGAPTPDAPRPAVRDNQTRDNLAPPLPSPPPRADTLVPLRTATSIMEDEARESASAKPPATPGANSGCPHPDGRTNPACAPAPAADLAKPRP